MNGRVFDATLGRFLSADPYITHPYNSQGYNRYTYVYNNPLSFTDPTGYVAPDGDGPENYDGGNPDATDDGLSGGTPNTGGDGNGATEPAAIDGNPNGTEENKGNEDDGGYGGATPLDGVITGAPPGADRFSRRKEQDKRNKQRQEDIDNGKRPGISTTEKKQAAYAAAGAFVWNMGQGPVVASAIALGTAALALHIYSMD